MNKIKLTEAKELLNNNISSIYTKQDVLSLLDRLDTGSSIENITEIFNKIRSEFSSDLTRVIERIVDKDDIKLELYGNEIIIDDVEIDTDVIEGVLSDVLESLEADFEEQK
jgi:Zn-dependent M32 family carboxypeptidase